LQTSGDVQAGTIGTRIAGRLDRLPWSRWHWLVVFFFASAGASAAYLTGSEVFPMEARAMALAFFYAVGTGIGGVTGPALFGKLVETGKEVNVFYGSLLASLVMIAGGVAEWLLGVDAEQKSLEEVARPLTAEEAEAEAQT
jgi:MFS family permease